LTTKLITGQNISSANLELFVEMRPRKIEGNLSSLLYL